MTSRIQVVDAGMLASAGAELIEKLIGKAIGDRGKAAIALSGGHTPEPVYRRLAVASTVAWDRVEVFFGDERAVPPDHNLSNYRMARNALLGHVPIPETAIHRMEAERPDADRAAAEYAALLPDRMDLILLGIGDDGHTASLFPGSVALDESERRVLPVAAATPPNRMTITPPVLAAARETLVMASGPQKVAAVRRALVEDVSPNECPARLVRDGRWLLDHAAATGLGALA